MALESFKISAYSGAIKPFKSYKSGHFCISEKNGVPSGAVAPPLLCCA